MGIKEETLAWISSEIGFLEECRDEVMAEARAYLAEGDSLVKVVNAFDSETSIGDYHKAMHLHKFYVKQVDRRMRIARRYRRRILRLMRKYHRLAREGWTIDGE